MNGIELFITLRCILSAITHRKLDIKVGERDKFAVGRGRKMPKIYM
jgi:hypothetical protein